MDSMTEVGITYCLLPDLDIQDSCQQIAIRGKDVAKWRALYESYVTNQLDLGGPLDFEELKALTSGNYKIKSLALGDASEDNEQLEQFLDILDERGVNYSVLRILNMEIITSRLPLRINLCNNSQQLLKHI